jgi:hypothetical protein
MDDYTLGLSLPTKRPKIVKTVTGYDDKGRIAEMTEQSEEEQAGDFHATVRVNWEVVARKHIEAAKLEAMKKAAAELNLIWAKHGAALSAGELTAQEALDACANNPATTPGEILENTWHCATTEERKAFIDRLFATKQISLVQGWNTLMSAWVGVTGEERAKFFHWVSDQVKAQRGVSKPRRRSNGKQS